MARKRRRHSAKRPWMPWYPADYMRDTQHLTDQQDLTYRRLIDFCWIQGGGLPANDEQIARIARLSIEDWRAMKLIILAFFDSKLRNPRVDLELKRTRKLSAKRARIAKTAHANRKQAAEKSDEKGAGDVHAIAEQLHTHSHSHSHIDDGDAGKPQDRIVDGVLKLSTEIAVLCGHKPRELPPAWVASDPERTLGALIEAGLREDMILRVVKSVVGKYRRKNRSPIQSIAYFANSFSDALASMKQAPLNLGPVLVSKKEARNGFGKPVPGWQQSRDNFREAHAELKRRLASDAGADGDGGEADRPPPRFIASS